MSIEGVNIEYGKIENCNIDTNLTSKIWRRVTSNTNDVNIEFSIENVNIETVTSKLASTYLTSTRSIRSIGSILDRSDWYRIDRIDPMAFWPNFKLFRPKLSPNRTKNGHFSLKMCVFSLKRAYLSLPKAKKNDYFRENRETRNTFFSVFSINTEIIAY